MRVLLLTSHFPPEKGSASQLFFELSETLSDNGHTVTVVTGFPHYLMWESRENGVFRRERVGKAAVVRVFNLPLRGWGRYRRGMDQVFMALAQFVGASFTSRPDVIVMYSPPLLTAVTAWLLSRLWQIPFVVNVQDLFPRSAVDLGLMKGRRIIQAFEALEAFVYRAADALAVISEGNRDHVIAMGAEPAKVEIISNWSDTSVVMPGDPDPSLRSELGLDDHFVIQYSGVMGYSQDLDTVIEAAALLRSETGIRFHLSGDGIARDRLVASAELNGLNNVVFTRLQPQDRYPALLLQADACLVALHPRVKSPSVPSKLFNIMAAGKPVILCAEANGDARRIVNEANCGFCVRAGDPRDLADVVLRLYRDKEAARVMGQNGRAVVEQQYSRVRSIGLYEDLLRKVIEQRESVHLRGDVPAHSIQLNQP